METDFGVMQLKRKAKNFWQPSESRKRQRRFYPYSHQREHDPDDILITDFQPPELQENKFLLF